MENKKKTVINLHLVIFLIVTGFADLNGFGATTSISTNVLVTGGSASGTAAAIQAARSGAHVVLIESTPWLGGMLTMAGVSATDGNHRLPSGLWGEFRNEIYKYYGGPEAVATGWVSNTQFEPHIGNRIFSNMVSEEDRIIRISGYHVVKCLLSDSRVNGAVFVNEAATDTLIIHAFITVDATESGDLMALAGCNYFIGQDSKSMTGESGAPDIATDIIQDMTFVAILKDYGPAADKTIPMPENYNPELYECTCSGACNNPVGEIYTCDKMFYYGKLPNGKYMINWPEKGNDFYLNDIEMDYYARKTAWQQAKNHTLGWIYFMQTRAGYSNLGLADDEFPTDDLLPFYPYYRESRRLDGVIELRNGDLTDPYKDTDRQYYRSAISVGDYPLDLHHAKMPREIYYSIEAISSFSVPYGCLIPKNIDGLIVAEKNISVTHIVNGCTRLQPSVLLIGQAAGAAAALCAGNQTEPRNLRTRELQQTLLNAGCWLLPYVDVTPQDPYFQQIEKIGLCGIMRGEGIAVDWANKTYFYPDLPVTKKELEKVINILEGKHENPLDLPTIRAEKQFVSRQQALDALQKYSTANENGKDNEIIVTVDYLNSKLPSSLKIDKKKLKEFITRKELACWVDALFNPFEDNSFISPLNQSGNNSSNTL